MLNSVGVWMGVDFCEFPGECDSSVKSFECLSDQPSIDWTTVAKKLKIHWTNLVEIGFEITHWSKRDLGRWRVKRGISSVYLKLFTSCLCTYGICTLKLLHFCFAKNTLKNVCTHTALLFKNKYKNTCLNMHTHDFDREPVAPYGLHNTWIWCKINTISVPWHAQTLTKRWPSVPVVSPASCQGFISW